MTEDEMAGWMSREVTLLLSCHSDRGHKQIRQQEVCSSPQIASGNMESTSSRLRVRD